MSVAKIKLKKDDLVSIIAGKEIGKKGKVLAVYPQTKKVLVEKINMVKKHTKPSGANQQGGIIDKESPLDISNVMVLCLKCDKGVRVKRKLFDDGKRARVCVKCGEIVDRK